MEKEKIIFNVFNGEYPFEEFLGQVSALRADEAMTLAKIYHPHPALQPVSNIQPEEYNG